MPTSTRWRSRRQPRDPVAPRGASPVRPSPEFVDRFSPDPTLPSAGPEPPAALRPTQENGALLAGLGLSGAGVLDRPDVHVQPDHLYFDQDGAAHVGARLVATGADGHAAAHRAEDSMEWSLTHNQKSRRHSGDARARGHTRSGSTIDDLATAAIASPALAAAASPRSLSREDNPSDDGARPLSSHRRTYLADGGRVLDDDGPPAKRVKSERIPAREWPSPELDRPKTSGDITEEEVMLLLGLKNEINFKHPSSLLSPAQNRAPTPPADDHYPPLGNGALAQHARGRSTSALTEFRHDREMYNETAGFGRDAVTGAGVGLDAARDAAPLPPSSAQHQQLPSQRSITNPYSTSVPGAPTDSMLSVVDQVPPLLPPNALPGSAEQPASGAPPKRQRRIKPEVQAEVCAACQRLQRDTDDKRGTEYWIKCDACEKWYHSECAGFKSKEDARSVDKFICKDCEPTHGKSTYVRKSTRPRTAIDYAGLNQGLVQSSSETTMHHYIKPIKEGKVTLQPDDFARIRPELLTVDLWEGFDGMKRPFVVPAAWNPRFGAKKAPEVDEEAPDDTRQAADSDAATGVLFDGDGRVSVPDPPEPFKVVEHEVLDCDQDILDMVIPRDLTVRKVANMYGLDETVPVIDVKTQATKGQWTLSQWADYYEQDGDKPIRNVISLEVSRSPLGKLIRRPKVVRDLDLEDNVWEDADGRTKKKPVQFYCLMSVADSYTDFHIDFGGSSVYYHILKGTKTFFFIPPEDKYLKKYEDWCNSDTQNETWLGDLCGGNVTRVDLHEGDTAFIPAGWIHSVWTPEDSLVIGGNFLTRVDYEMQLKVVQVEKATKVAPMFKYPYFQKVMWYALINYLESDPIPPELLDDFQEDPDYVYLRANPIYNEIGFLENMTEPGEPEYSTRTYPKSELAGLPALRDYLYRTARIDAGLPVPDVTKKQADAVKASIPKGYGESLVLIKHFAIWCAWKRGNEHVPAWVHSDNLFEVDKVEKAKKPEVFRLPGERSSSRRPVPRSLSIEPAPTLTPRNTTKNSSKGSGLRVACEPCRKRRIKCRHKSGSNAASKPAPEIRPRSFSNAEGSISKDMANAPAAEQLSSPDAQFSEPLVNAETAPMVNGTELGSASKKSRSKACEDCRKSKRRCVHDEYGRIDPAKVAEPSKPRGSSATKRPSHLMEDMVRKSGTANFITDDLIDPMLTNGNAIANDNEEAIINSDDQDELHLNGSVLPRKRDATQLENGAGHVDHPSLGGGGSTKVKTDPDRDDEAETIVLTPQKPIVPSVNGSSGRSRASHRSAASPKTPVPSANRPTPGHKDRRASSAASAGTMITTAKSRRSSSNTSGTTHQIAADSAVKAATQGVAGRSGSRETSAGVLPLPQQLSRVVEVDPDEALARELQAQELGLRRRASGRA